MESCSKCGKPTHTFVGNGLGGYLCLECRDKQRQEKVLEKAKSLTKCSDFKQWDSGDMSELFWIHLGRYVKEPNPESIYYMELAYRWACHDNHGISNSFSHAMKWAGIDLMAEKLRWRKESK